MPETEYSQQNLADILTRLGNVESMLRFSVAASADIKAHVTEALRSREGAAEVYLLLSDGPLSQSEVMGKTGYSKANASKICSHLVRCGLVARDSNVPGKGVVWRWSDVEDVVGVSRIATKLARSPSASTLGRGDESAPSI